MTLRGTFRVAIVLLGFLAVQQTLMLDVRFGGVHPDIMVVLPVVAGIVGGPGRGASIGFASGLVSDLLLPTPFGLSSLVGCLLGFGVGAVTVPLDRTARWLPPLAALAGSALYEAVYAVLGSVLGQPQMLHVDLARIVVVVSVTNAVIALPAMWVMSWALPQASTEGVPTSPASSGALR